MKLSDLPLDEIRRRLASGKLALETGPFAFRVTSPLPEFGQTLRLLYGDFPLATSSWIDFRLSLQPRRSAVYFNRKAELFIDGRRVFAPIARKAASANFEWALNWWIYNNAHQFLIIHAAVVSMAGEALLLCGPPGSGKSTLCAALMAQGWRLHSDELALFEGKGDELRALARPVSLKNDSIEVIAKLAPHLIFGPEVPETHKGRIVQIVPTSESVQKVQEKAAPRWIVFPEFKAGSQTTLRRVPKANAFMTVAENAFNYRMRGQTAFRQLARTLDDCECFNLTFSQIEEAMDLLAGITTADERKACGHAKG